MRRARGEAEARFRNREDVNPSSFCTTRAGCVWVASPHTTLFNTRRAPCTGALQWRRRAYALKAGAVFEIPVWSLRRLPAGHGSRRCGGRRDGRGDIDVVTAHLSAQGSGGCWLRSARLVGGPAGFAAPGRHRWLEEGGHHACLAAARQANLPERRPSGVSCWRWVPVRAERMCSSCSGTAPRPGTVPGAPRRQGRQRPPLASARLFSARPGPKRPATRSP